MAPKASGWLSCVLATVTICCCLVSWWRVFTKTKTAEENRRQKLVACQLLTADPQVSVHSCPPFTEARKSLRRPSFFASGFLFPLYVRVRVNIAFVKFGRMLNHHCRRNPELHEELQIQAAVAAGDVYTVRRMLEQGYSPKIRDANGWTLLHFSAAKGKERCVRVFLEHGGQFLWTARALWTSARCARYDVKH